MYCRHCGEQLEDKAEICFNCGNKPLADDNYCPECGAQTTSEMEQCLNCGKKLKVGLNLSDKKTRVLYSEKSKAAAGTLAVVLGAFGAHDFYLGDSSKGWTKFILSVATGGIAAPFVARWSLADAVKIFAGQRDDADGLPLR